MGMNKKKGKGQGSKVPKQKAKLDGHEQKEGEKTRFKGSSTKNALNSGSFRFSL